MTPAPQEPLSDLTESLEDGFGRKRANRDELRRAENVQLVVAIGVLTIAGTLYVNNQISFPLLESAASVSYTRTLFRYFIYSTILFVVAKVATITIYPFTDNGLVLLIHDRIEPFLYAFSPLLITLGVGFGILIGQIGADTLVTATSTIISASLAIIYSWQAGKTQKEERKEEKARGAAHTIIGTLLASDSFEDSPITVDEIVDRTELTKNEVDELTSRLSNNSASPVMRDGDEVWITNLAETFAYLNNIDADKLYISNVNEMPPDF